MPISTERQHGYDVLDSLSEDCLTVEDLARVLRKSASTVQRLAKAGKLPAGLEPLPLIGRTGFRWRKQKVRRWLDADGEQPEVKFFGSARRRA